MADATRFVTVRRSVRLFCRVRMADAAEGLADAAGVITVRLGRPTLLIIISYIGRWRTLRTLRTVFCPVFHPYLPRSLLPHGCPASRRCPRAAAPEPSAAAGSTGAPRPSASPFPAGSRTAHGC